MRRGSTRAAPTVDISVLVSAPIGFPSHGWPSVLCLGHSGASMQPRSLVGSLLTTASRSGGLWLVEFRLLGSVEAWAHGGRLNLGPPQRRAVLAALLVDAGRTVAIETLIDRVWGQDAPVGARRALHAHVARIRRMLVQLDAAFRLAHRSTGYTVDVDPALVDWHRFQSLVAAAGHGGIPDGERARLLGEALDLWQGTPLADVPSDWAARIRERWRQQRLDAAVRWAEVELRLGRHDEVIGPVRGLLEEHPLVEPLAAALLRALALAGRHAEALDRYAAMRAHLSDELGTEPGPALKRTASCDPAR